MDTNRSPEVFTHPPAGLVEPEGDAMNVSAGTGTTKGTQRNRGGDVISSWLNTHHHGSVPLDVIASLEGYKRAKKNHRLSFEAVVL